MKKQYEATWYNTDGNRHQLWPIYENCEKEARQRAIDFMLFRWGKRFVDIDSLKVKQT
jgi:hypothetical protein